MTTLNKTTPKKSLLKSSHPKKSLPNFPTQQNPEIENFKPKKILQSSPTLEIPDKEFRFSCRLYFCILILFMVFALLVHVALRLF